MYEWNFQEFLGIDDTVVVISALFFYSLSSGSVFTKFVSNHLPCITRILVIISPLTHAMMIIKNIHSSVIKVISIDFLISVQFLGRKVGEAGTCEIANRPGRLRSESTNFSTNQLIISGSTVVSYSQSVPTHCTGRVDAIFHPRRQVFKVEILEEMFSNIFSDTLSSCDIRNTSMCKPGRKLWSSGVTCDRKASKERVSQLNQTAMPDSDEQREEESQKLY